MLEWPYVNLMMGWPSFVLAQVGAFAFAILLCLLWPKYPRETRKSYVLLLWTEFLALVLIVCIV